MVELEIILRGLVVFQKMWSTIVGRLRKSFIKIAQKQPLLEPFIAIKSLDITRKSVYELLKIQAHTFKINFDNLEVQLGLHDLIQ